MSESHVYIISFCPQVKFLIIFFHLYTSLTDRYIFLKNDFQFGAVFLKFL